MIFETTSERKRNPPTDVLLTLSITIVLCIILFSTHPYLTLTYDSYDYIAASLSADVYLNGSNPDGFAYLVRPPLMPLFLHLSENKVFVATLLNILAFGASLYICLKLARHIIPDALTIGLFIISVTFSYSFLQLHFFLWTEPLFAAIMLGVFYCMLTKKPVYQVIVLLVLAFLLRKAAGFVTLAAIAVYLNEGNIRQAVMVALAMVTVFIGWEVFTFIHMCSSASASTWSHHITFSRIPHLDSVTSWILPRVLPIAARILVVVVIAIITVLGARTVLVDFWSQRKNQQLFIFWSAYICSVFVFWGARDFDEADRYLSVALPLFMLTCFSIFSQLIVARKYKRLLCLLPILWLTYPISKCVYHLLTIRFP